MTDDDGRTPPRDAATVVLVRDTVVGTNSGVEVFVIRRVPEMAAAGGMTVFPGGGVDPRDAETDIAWAGPEPGWWAQAFATEEPLARSLVCAAVRETFEECGVLLAGDGDAVIVTDTAIFEEARTALVDKSMSLATFLRRESLVLRADLLRPLANWITPVGKWRRFDTKFLVAALPDGQSADDRTSEAVDGGWRRPADVLDAWRNGDVSLLPPTWAQLEYISTFGSVDALLVTPREITAVLPTSPSDGSAVEIEFDGADRYWRR